MQHTNREPQLEAILLARPDVVLTMHRASVDLLEQNRVPTVFLAWRQPEDVKACMTLLGEVFGKPAVPELSADADVPAEVKAFYGEFFGYQLTDTQIAEILSGTL